MKTPSLNLFIVDDNRSAAEGLKDYLVNRFGEGIRILTFADRKSCLGKVDNDTNIIILNDHLQGENGVEILKDIKDINPETEVIMLAEQKDIGLEIESFRAGAKGLIIKGPGSEKKAARLVSRIFMAPIRIIEKELGLSARLAIFIMVFITIGVMVLLYSLFWK
jgi:DNA-binding NarL/FixJ family response regulator